MQPLVGLIHTNFFSLKKSLLKHFDVEKDQRNFFSHKQNFFLEEKRFLGGIMVLK
jgi:hypothetical protein